MDGKDYSDRLVNDLVSRDVAMEHNREDGKKRNRSPNHAGIGNDLSKRQSCALESSSNSKASAFELQRNIIDTMYGFMWKGRRKADSLDVAVKISDMDKAEGIVSKEDPIAESRILSILSRGKECAGKRHVCHLLAQFLEVKNPKSRGPQLWTVLEWANGGELLYQIKTQPNQTTDLARDLFRQLVEGVEYIHSNKIAHMDLSMENIMMHYTEPNSKPTVKIIDFGMAVMVGKDDKETMKLYQGDLVRGKPSYMAPEVFEQKDINPFAADVYSLGVILFILLTEGTPPYSVIGDAPFTKIWSGKNGIDWLLEHWGFELSHDAIDLLSRLLCPKTQRASIQDILAHPFVKR